MNSDLPSFLPVFAPVAAVVLLLVVLGLAVRSVARERATARRMRAIVDHAMVGIARTSLDKRWVEVNPALCRILGYSADELTRKTWAEMTHPDDLVVNEAKFDAVLRGELDHYLIEKRFMRKDGAVVYAFVAASAVRKQDGGIDFFSTIVEDITERRLAELRLARQVARSAVLLNLPRKAEELSERAFMRYALDEAERLTDSWIGFMHFVNGDGESIELVAWSQNTLEKCNAAYDSHYPIKQAGIWADAVRERVPVIINDYGTATGQRGLPEGHSVLTRLISVPVIEGGVVRMMTGVGNKATPYALIDVETVQLIGNETWRIVRRRRSESALRLATQVVNASPVVCFRWAATEGWPVVFVSDNVMRWGYTAEQLQAGQRPFAALIHPDDSTHVADAVARNTAAGMNKMEQEFRLLTADGGVIWVLAVSTIERDADGDVVFYDGVLTEITERKDQQLALAENLDRQRQLNKRLEEAHNQLLQSEKMASIGQLAAGVAHELNNPIGFVHSNLGTLDGYLHDLMAVIDEYEKAGGAPVDTAQHPDGVSRVKQERDFDFLKDDVFKLVAESKEGIGRVRKIVQDLKSFSRVGEQEWKEADLHQGIDSTLNIVWNELKYKCKIVKDYGDIPPVHCLISQLNQVFMNLLVNAGQAIEKQGTVTIRTRRDGEDRVCVEIGDTGKGIAPENLNRVFEPFFTTKPVGKGTGLGLSLSYSIIERHQGRIEVDSRLGHGTTFRVLLPIHHSIPADEETTSETTS
jgi:PAS domain S-box-containing protein